MIAVNTGGTMMKVKLSLYKQRLKMRQKIRLVKNLKSMRVMTKESLTKKAEQLDGEPPTGVPVASPALHKIISTG